METILVLVYAEADGSLAKPAREALGAAKSLQASLDGSTLVVSDADHDRILLFDLLQRRVTRTVLSTS